MAMAIQQISPVAHLPLVLGVVRKLNADALIDTFCPPHPAHVLSCGRGVVYPTAADNSMASKTRYNAPSHHAGEGAISLSLSRFLSGMMRL